MATSIISANEAVRSFSELLNGIRIRGEHYTIVREGKAVATIGPVEAVAPVRRLGELSALLRDLPGLEPDDASFAADVAAGVSSQPPLPHAPPWE